MYKTITKVKRDHRKWPKWDDLSPLGQAVALAAYHTYANRITRVTREEVLRFKPALPLQWIIPTPKLTDRELEVIAHALGIPVVDEHTKRRAARWAYRNHYVADGADEEVWRGLVKKGYATAGRRSSFIEGTLFRVTAAGIEAAMLGNYVPTKMRKSLT